MDRTEFVTAYIDNAPEFARPILHHLRDLVHRACPKGEEARKWGMPCFLYQGQMLCSFAAFKQHATFGFWRAGEIIDNPPGIRAAMGQFGRLTGRNDLPEDAVLTGYIEKAMALIDSGAKAQHVQSRPRPPVETPDDFQAALDANPAAARAYADFAPSHKREYVSWIMEAKRAETRQRRIAQAIVWLAEGKARNWKYM